MKKNNSRGFTLIELMVAASILGLIGMAILTAFGSGFHVYERVQSYGGVQADVLLVLEEMERDLRNTFPSSAIKFEGDAQSISFPVIIEKIETVEGEDVEVPSIGQASYYLEKDDDTQVLLRQQKSYGEAVSGVVQKEDRETALAFVSELTFSYYLFNAEDEEYTWEDIWPEEDEGFPSGVKIDLVFQDGQREVPLSRTVLIPSIRMVDTIVGLDEEEEEGEVEGEV